MISPYIQNKYGPPNQRHKKPVYEGTVICPSCNAIWCLKTTDKELLEPGKAPKCFQCFMDNK